MVMYRSVFFFFIALFILQGVFPLITQAEDDQAAWLAQQKKIDRLISQLGSQVSGTAAAALNQLVQIGEPAVMKLISKLGSRNPAVRMYSVSALGKIGDIRAVERIRNMLKLEKTAVAIIAAAKALHSFGDNSGGAKVLPFITHPQQDVRRFAITTLGKIAYAPALAPLLKRITLDETAADPKANVEKNPAVLCDLSLALFMLGNKSGLPILSNLSRHEQFPIRLFAVQGLTHFDDGLAYLALAVAISDPDSRISDLAYKHLYMKRKIVIPALQRMYLEKEASPELKEAIKSALNELGGKVADDVSDIVEEKLAPGESKTEKDKVAPLLQKVRSTVDEERKAGLAGLLEIGAKAIPAILLALPNESNEVKMRLIGLFVQIKDARALLPLREMVVEEEKNIRCRSAWALGEISAKQNVPVLISCLEDEDSTVRFYVINSLAKLTGLRHGFEARGTDETRAAAVVTWKKWWADNSATFEIK